MTGVKRVGLDEKRDFRVDDNECEVSTVDSIQGRDMDVVILSAVKNVDEGVARYIYCINIVIIYIPLQGLEF